MNCVVSAIVVTSSLAVGNLWADENKTDQKQMSRDELITLALSAGPAHIAKDASVMIHDENGKLVEVRKGANGFTCVPMVDPTTQPDPVCMDKLVLQYYESYMKGDPKPANTAPGISYMAQGAHHWEKNGKVLKKGEPGAQLIKDPPHVMIMWPFDSRTTGIPTCPIDPGKPARPGVVCIVLHDTPYAFLMIYQGKME